MLKMIGKYGSAKVHSVMKVLGINPFTLTANSSKFIALARGYNNVAITLSKNWAFQLYNKAKELGFKISLDEPHGKYGWHMHLSGANGKLSKLHIQITKSAWNYLSKILK